MNSIDHHTLQRLVSAGATVGADVVGQAGGWHVVIRYGQVSQPLVATRGKPRMFRNFSTLANYLKDLGVVEFKVNTVEFDPKAKDANDARRVLASDRLKAAHAAADHDKWFRAQVAEALAETSDPNAPPSIPHEVVKAEMAKQRAALQKRIAKAGKRCG